MQLLETMRRRRVSAMIADAHFLQQQEESAERTKVIEIEKRQTMYEFALGRITLQERDVIFQALNGRKQ